MDDELLKQAVVQKLKEILSGGVSKLRNFFRKTKTPIKGKQTSFSFMDPDIQSKLQQKARAARFERLRDSGYFNEKYTNFRGTAKKVGDSSKELTRAVGKALKK